MTVLQHVSRVRGLCRQLLMVVLINIPTVSLGLAMGWVSLASGERSGGGEDGGEAGGRVVAAAATTFLASLVGVPLSARALANGRKFAVIATSACFLVCWALKLVGGGWWVVSARVAAGLGGAGAFSIPPLVAREMCEASVHGAASSALILAHNLGFLLMYLAADLGLQHNTVAWACLGVSALHCALFLFVPESPAFLCANGKQQEAAASLAWLRGLPVGHPALSAELAALPPPDPVPLTPFALLKDLLKEQGRRRAFIISFVAIVGQEACGVYTLMQFAERAFVLARDAGVETAVLTANSTGVIANEHGNGTISVSTDISAGDWSNATTDVSSSEIVLLSPARQAVILGAVQLVASMIGLYLVEKVGRRRLLVWAAVVTALCLASGGAAVLAARGAGAGAGVALAAAVGADSAGLQTAPYALLADMFHYQVLAGRARGGRGAGAGRAAAGVALAAAVGADSAGLQTAPYALLADMFHCQVLSSSLYSIYTT
ncbi:unnamed protein product [Chilo suppressalis]|uniref:Major facilitator superfamily (MFS) profile domain-containing protein n=1 Tax=Chilo suppressalis TaxID=168631 RepID=A0ABN8B4F4_CHISP|nr:unnamed protein product [Chilo suppressalis]